MKKLFCLSLVFILCCCLAGCNGKVKSETKVEYPFEEVSATYDVHGQLLHQMLLNKETGEYFLKEFTYEYINGLWVCANQHTTVIAKKESNSVADDSLNIYYNYYLSKGHITIMDNEYTTISIVKYLTKDDWWEFGYELKIENKTNQVISVLIDDCYIMGIQCKPLFSIDHIDAGKTAFFRAGWDKDTLTRSHIPYIDNVEFMIRIFDNNNWKVPALAGTRILIKQ